MKYLFICVLILLSISLNAQSVVSRTGKPVDKSDWNIAYRNYAEKDTNWLVKYCYKYTTGVVHDVIRWRYDSISNKTVSDAEAYRPWVHYIAEVTVFRLTNKDSLIVGKPFWAEYVPHGCFEDDPKMLVAKAKTIKQD